MRLNPKVVRHLPVGSVPDPRLAPSSTSLNGGTWLFSPTPVFIPNFSSTRGGATSSVKLPAAGSVNMENIQNQ